MMVPPAESRIPVAVPPGQENRLPSFGEKLKFEREKRAITLEQISLSTKIGTRMLQALEEEKFNQLPGGIFNKGFVRAYARHVGLDEEQTVADYLEASGEGPVLMPGSTPSPEPVPVEIVETAPPRQIPWGMLAAILLAVALVLFIWSRQHRRAGQNPGTDAAPASGSRSSLSDSASANPTPLSSPAKVEAIPLATPPPGPAGQASASRKTAAETSTSPSPGEFTVAVLASEESWLSISVDGKIILAETLVEGNQRVVHAGKEVVVRAGNVGGLDFVFNGKKLPSQGDYGEAKTITFGPGGLEPKAPAAPTKQ